MTVYETIEVERSNSWASINRFDRIMTGFEED